MIFAKLISVGILLSSAHSVHVKDTLNIKGAAFNDSGFNSVDFGESTTVHRFTPKSDLKQSRSKTFVKKEFGMENTCLSEGLSVKYNELSNSNMENIIRLYSEKPRIVSFRGKRCIEKIKNRKSRKSRFAEYECDGYDNRELYPLNNLFEKIRPSMFKAFNAAIEFNDILKKKYPEDEEKCLLSDFVYRKAKIMLEIEKNLPGDWLIEYPSVNKKNVNKFISFVSYTLEMLEISA
ncbi:hypothetical protein AYI70_g8446 [Smittium culicis]|uniref:Uncharacterized protein n=1 Tax=Smittium culicis TaxID=133412 RepID=A0A1R1XFW4_9FUNG|nr:hypothetical protein AYI70_g8446 [Smittium culicis]